MSRLTRYLVPLVLAFFMLAVAGPASAQKVANPGNFNFKLTSGLMKVKDQEFGFDESQNINFTGTIDKAGNVSIPSITFPDYPISASGFNLTVKINVVGPTTGTINPLNGVASLRLKVWIKIDGVPLGGSCAIASSSSPIDVNALVTGVSGSRTGTPYDYSTGTMRLVNSTYAVPSSSGCGIAAGTVDSTVGLPSPAGQNGAEFNIKATPNVNRGIVPVLNATPASGTAPLTTTLSATGSTATAGVASYRWDFNNDGTIDQTTTTASVTHAYTTGGSQTARVQVVDSEGDTADATRAVTVNAYPDLAIAASHDADFRVGSTGHYRINLNNQGYAATSGPVTVTSTLPAGLSYAGVNGSGWSCSAVDQALTCTRSTAIAAGASAPELGVDLNVGPAARGQIEPTFTVATTGDNGAGNNAASDPTQVRATDLKLTVSHSAHAMVPGEDPANVLEITAENIGDAPTVGSTVMVDDLPAGLTPLSASGSGWSCVIDGQKVTCTHDGPIAPGESRSVEVTVSAALEPDQLGTTVTNQATVTTADDASSDNNTASEPVLILDGQDVGITKSHTGDFTAGQAEHYELTVTNEGTRPTTGPTTVTDALPSSLGYVAVDGGPDWDCSQDDGTVTCEYAGILEPGETAPAIDLTVSVSVAAIPAVTNTAQVSTAGDPNPANDSSSDDAVVQAIDMTISKAHQGQIRIGRQAVYTLGVTNVGDSPTTGPTTVTDTLPAGLEFVSAEGGADWNCSEAAGTVNCEYEGSLGASQSAPDISLTTLVGPAAAPEVANSAEVTTQDDFNPDNNEATDSAVAIDVDTGISISRTGTFRPGHTGTYLIVVGNEGAVPTANQTDVSVDLPVGLEFNSVSGAGWDCSEDDGTVSCTRPAGLGADSTAPAISLRVNVTAAAVPGVETTATATTEGDRYPDNDSDTNSAAIAGADLQVSSSHDGAFLVGEANSYVVEVGNQGNGATDGPITLTDTLPDGFEVQSVQSSTWNCGTTGQVVSCSRSAPLAAGDSANPIRIDVIAATAALPAGEAAATVDNQVEVSTAADSNSANDSAADPTDLIAIDAAIAVDGPAAATAGATVEYGVTVENTGSAEINGVVRVVDTLPAGFAPRSSSGNDWTCASAGRKVTCDYSRPVPTGAALPALTIRGWAGSDLTGSAVNQVSVVTGGDIDSTNDSGSVSTEISSAPDLELGIKATSPGGARLQVGNDNTYLVSVRNGGTAEADGPVSVKVQMPAGMSFLGMNSGEGWDCTAAGSTVNCVHSESIDAGAVSSFSLQVALGAAAADAVSVSASVDADGDANPENDDAVAVNEVVRLDLALTRAHSTGWTRGTAGTYGLTVTNQGTAATVGPVTLTENLPQGSTFVSSTGEGWNCGVSRRTLTCENENRFDAGDASDLGITLDIGVTAGPSVEASSRISTMGDSNSANDVATDRIEISDPPGSNRIEPIRIRTRKLTPTTDGTATVWLECPVGSAARCQGTLTLKTKGKVKVKPKAKAKLKLGQNAYSVAPGRQVPVRVKLTKRARKALKLSRTIRTVASATNVGSGPSTGSILIRKPR